MVYYTFSLCKSGGFKVEPKGNIKINLLELSEKFKHVKMKTKMLLIVELNDARASIYPSGKIILHNCSEENGEIAAAEIYKKIKSVIS